METFGNSITESDESVELCKKVQMEGYIVHVVRSPNFYSHLQFSLLDSTWFPCPLGACLWSALHMLLALCEALMLLVLFPIAFVLAVLMDAILVATIIWVVLKSLFTVIFDILLQGIAVALIWIWLVITCCTVPGRAPGQGLGHYVRTVGGTLQPQDLQPAPVVEGGAADADEPRAFLNVCCSRAFLRMCWRDYFSMKLVNHVILVSFPYWREKLGDLCREIVPRYDTIVI